MKRLAIILGAAALLAVVGAGVAGVAAHAQGATPDRTGTLDEYVEQIWDAVASKLGIAREDLEKAVTEARQEVADQAVEDGAIDQDQADRITEGPLGSFGFHPMGPRGGHRGHPGPSGCPGNQEALADELGMTADELAAEIEAGKTLDEIAEEKGVDLAAVRLEALKADLAAKVEAGEITQEQADWLLEGMEQGYTEGHGGRLGSRGLMGRGDWGRAPDAPDAQAVPEGDSNL